MARLLETLVVFAIVIFLMSCAPTAAPFNERNTIYSLNDPARARNFSDSFAEDLKENRTHSLKMKFGNRFRKGNAEEFDSMISSAHMIYGQILEYEFKQVESGATTNSDGSTQPVQKFWYAIRTTKHAKGGHFLIIEVAPEDSTLAISTFSIVEFPLGIPSSLQ